MSLNVSPPQLAHPDFTDDLAALLAEWQIEPERVTLEVTESALNRAAGTTAEVLAEVRTLGVGLSLDDFGTGYSTLTRLMAFPVTELKIDRQFTIETGGSASVIVPAIVGLAHGSGLTVVAEGIETQRQCALVMADGCDYGQGYLFSRPVPGDQVPQIAMRGFAGPGVSADVTRQRSVEAQ